VRARASPLFGGLRGTGMVSSEAGYQGMTSIMLVAKLAALVGHNM